MAKAFPKTRLGRWGFWLAVPVVLYPVSWGLLPISASSGPIAIAVGITVPALRDRDRSVVLIVISAIVVVLVLGFGLGELLVPH
jgi:hypothetical protein